MNFLAVSYRQLDSSHPHSELHPYDDYKVNNDGEYDDFLCCIIQLIGKETSLGNHPHQEYHRSHLPLHLIIIYPHVLFIMKKRPHPAQVQSVRRSTVSEKS